MKRTTLPLLVAVAGVFALVHDARLTAQTLSSWPANSYQKVLDVANCGEKLFVDDASIFSADDWVMLIQNRGASMESEDCSHYGRLEDYGAAGNFELARIESVETAPQSGDDFIVLKACPSLFYYAAYPGTNGIPGDNGYGYQIVKVQYFSGGVIIDGKLNAPAWDASTGTGGVIAVVAAGTITLQADIDASGAGFVGGDPNGTNNSDADLTAYDYDPADNKAGLKGEGIVEVGTDANAGRGAPANGGGGGNGKNAGGGGGSNYGRGGVGGKQNSADGDVANGGVGGYDLTYDEWNRTRIFFGGGGGGGHRSAQGSGTDESKGGAGGGIILLMASGLIVDRAPLEGTSVDRKITANGEPGGDANSGSNGAGGGGAGGVVLMDIGSITVNLVEANLDLIIEAVGGNGGTTSGGSDCTGPGGGGGGGVVWFRGDEEELPAWMSVAIDKGNNGTASCNSTTVEHGADDGEDGAVKHDLTYPKWYAPSETPI